jgi:outer membrane lipoprotein-sorting protein
MRLPSKKFFLVGAAALLLAVATASAQDDLLSRTGKQVSDFLDQFSQLKCTEEVTQTKLVKKLSKQSIEYREQQTFDYLVLAQGSGDDLVIQESRLQQRASEHKKNVPLLVTNGFATLSLIFHPYYESAFNFSEPQRDVINGQAVLKVNFQHIQGRRSPTVLVLRGREYPLELKGTGWIDPKTATIVRIEAELQDEMTDVGLRAFKSEVEFAPVHFRGESTTPWLPSIATIELETAKQRWRNIHRFSNYQQFSVSTDESVKTQ